MAGYLIRVLIALDQLFSAIFGGHPDETISSRLGKAARGDYGPTWRSVTAPLRLLVDAVFALLGDHDHCRQSIEEDEGLA
jgi:hypothetical protein